MDMTFSLDSKYILLKICGLGILAFCTFTLAVILNSLILGILAAIMMLMCLFQYLYLKSFSYELKDGLLKSKKGVFTINTSYIELFRVEDFEVKQNLFDRMIDVVGYKIYSSDKTNSTFEIKGIKSGCLDDFEFRKIILDARKDNKIYGVIN